MLTSTITEEDESLTFCIWIQGRNHFLGQFYWVHVHLLKIERLVNDIWRFLQAMCLFSGTSCQGNFSGGTSELLLLYFTCQTATLDANTDNISYVYKRLCESRLFVRQIINFLSGGSNKRF